MIIALIAVVVLVAVSLAVTYLNMKAAERNAAAAEEFSVSAEQLVDAIAGVTTIEDDMRDMREQLLALRKQQKAVLSTGAQVFAQAERVLDKQYRQQKDVDDILYHAKIREERAGG